MEVKEKYKEYLNTRNGIDTYNKFKEILYGTPDSLVVRLFWFFSSKIRSKSIEILDVGGGDGKRLKLLISLLKAKGITSRTTLVEPSSIFIKDLQRSLLDHEFDYEVETVQSLFEDFSSKKKFDVILFIHSIYTFKDKKYIENIKKLLKPNGFVIFASDNKVSFLAKLKALTDSDYGSKRKDTGSVLRELKEESFTTEEAISITTYSDCLLNGQLNDEGKLILSWIALKDFRDISKETLEKATKLFLENSEDGKIKDKEIFIYAKT